MKYLTFSLIIFLFSTITYSKCFETSSKNITIQWTAFKTPSKIGVKGKLPAITLKSKTSGSSIREISKGMVAEIDTSKIDTKNPARDKKIAKWFFSTIDGGNKILAKITEIKEDKLILNLKINGVNKDIPMNFTILDKELRAEGVMDVLDFKLSDELKAINKACYALHSGKTWNDVNLELTALFTKCSS